MHKLIFVLLFHLSSFPLLAQTNKEIAYSKGMEAIKLMDEGKIDESINILKVCQKLDPDNYVYPYEIAFAHVQKDEYGKAIKILNKVKKYKTINSQVYQLLGNCHSFNGSPEKAIKEYEEGMKYFPNAGNLYLEKGNIFLGKADYLSAIENYEKGIAIAPYFPSNYYRLAKLLLSSNDKLSGLIYGEIFMNLEMSSQRTLEMSELLFKTYKAGIFFAEDSYKVDLCKIVIDGADFKSNEAFKFPFCAVFAKHFALAIIGEQSFGLESFSRMRQKFIQNFFKEDFKSYPNALLSFQKSLLDEGLFDAYNHYLFQMRAEEEFEGWLETNKEDYKRFAEWYIQDQNSIEITTENRFIR